VLTLLGQAQRECPARGDLAAHQLDDHAIWHFHAARVWIAAEALREAVDPPLPRRPSTQPRRGRIRSSY
jgi:hypothetical protein